MLDVPKDPKEEVDAAGALVAGAGAPNDPNEMDAGGLSAAA